MSQKILWVWAGSVAWNLEVTVNCGNLAAMGNCAQGVHGSVVMAVKGWMVVTQFVCMLAEGLCPVRRDDRSYW